MNKMQSAATNLNIYIHRLYEHDLNRGHITSVSLHLLRAHWKIELGQQIRLRI